MTEQCTRVNIDDLVAGMVLAQDAVHMNGRVLLCSGTCLTEKHLKVFKTWGLTEAQIKGGTGEEVSQHSMQHLDPASVKDAEQALQEKFRHMDMGLPAAAELFRVCVRHYVERQAMGS